MDNKTTDYRISTITAVGNINSIIDLQQFFDIFNPTNNIVYVEYGKTKNISNVKGIHPKKKPKKKKKDSKRFDNQATVFIKLQDETYANMKIFKNGKIQMTGLKTINNGIEAINTLINYVKNIHTEKNKILDNIENVKLTNYKICLINSDFKFEHKIKRNSLYKFIVDNTGLICSYEPCIYPGVKIQYFYNDDNDGVCKCSEYCDNKKKTSECSKITIAIFESGCTIITGAKNINQINTTYKFINNLVNNNINSFKKKELPMLE
jgi:TATA-box binding protein (TBP) (component of TFIID and TFIIIB)